MYSTDLQVESSYVEDGELCILVSPKEKGASASVIGAENNHEPRWRIIADPKTKAIRDIQFFVSTNDGFEYPDYTPTKAQMKIFTDFAASKGLNE